MDIFEELMGDGSIIELCHESEGGLHSAPSGSFDESDMSPVRYFPSKGDSNPSGYEPDGR
jgi:hypothetical protein